MSRVPAVLAVLVAGAMAVPAVAGATFEIIPADEAATLPSAGGRTVPMDSRWEHGGVAIAPSTALQRKLACFEDESPTTRCYSSIASMAAAENVLTPRASSARKRNRRHAHRSYHPGDPLTVWMSTNYTGSSLSLSSSCAWYDLTGSWDNNAESAYAGNHSYYLSQFSGGGGVNGGDSAYNYVASFYIYNNYWSSRWRRGC